MRHAHLSLTVACTLALATLAGCGTAAHPHDAGLDPEPLHVRRPSGEVDTVTFAEAMAWHHAHETPHPRDAATEGEAHEAADHDHDEAVCAGVATGYQAVRYAAARLFPGEVPDAADLEIGATGPMPGLWDMLDFYTGQTLNRPARAPGRLSLASFTLTAQRPSTGRAITFRLREGLIPGRFFELKNQGMNCGHPEVARLKNRAARALLTHDPEACFVELSGGGDAGAP